MRFYTVHVRRPARDPAADVVLVKEGFSWPAFLFSGLWALANRLWLVAAALFAAEIALAFAAQAFALDPRAFAALSAGLALLAGWLGNDLRRWTLEGRGFGQSAVVTGADHDAALARFLARDGAAGLEPAR
jgi:hypothetical protein